MLAVTPIKNTKIPAVLSKIAVYDNFKRYKAALLNQIQTGGPASGAIVADLKGALRCWRYRKKQPQRRQRER